MRRLSFRSALTAALATRMMPVLTRDARRMEDARRCRPGAAAPSGAWPSCAPSTAGALDRSVDVAATLELRGFARRAPRAARAGPPFSRHDVAVAASARRAVRCSASPRLAGRASRRSTRTRRSGCGRPGGRGSTRPRSWRSRCAVREQAGDRAVSTLTFEHFGYRYPGGAEPALRDVSLARRCRRVRRPRRALGVRQVDADARGVRSRAALPRRRGRRARASSAASTRASTARPTWRRSAARCSRSPRRRS